MSEIDVLFSHRPDIPIGLVSIATTKPPAKLYNDMNLLASRGRDLRRSYDKGMYHTLKGSVE